MHKKRGFTLIELLVVIAIIALLMSILMPALAKVRKQAMSVVCRSRMKQWGVVFSMYTSENDGFFNTREIGTAWGYSRTWPFVYKALYIEPKMRFCPAAENAARYTGAFGTWNYEGGEYFPLPNLKMKGEREYQPFQGRPEYGTFADGYFTGSFGMNRYVENMKGVTTEAAAGYFRRIDVKGGDKVPVLLDCQYLYFMTGPDASPPAYDGDFSGPQMRWICINRHMGYVNGVFLDCSARKVGLKELWALKHSKTYDTCDPAGWTICTFGGDRNLCHAAWHDAVPWMDKFPEY